MILSRSYSSDIFTTKPEDKAKQKQKNGDVRSNFRSLFKPGRAWGARKIKKGREGRAKEGSRYSAFINYGGVVEVRNPAPIEAGLRRFIFLLSH